MRAGSTEARHLHACGDEGEKGGHHVVVVTCDYDGVCHSSVSDGHGIGCEERVDHLLAVSFGDIAQSNGAGRAGTTAGRPRSERGQGAVVGVGAMCRGRVAAVRNRSWRPRRLPSTDDRWGRVAARHQPGVQNSDPIVHPPSPLEAGPNTIPRSVPAGSRRSASSERRTSRCRPRQAQASASRCSHRRKC